MVVIPFYAGRAHAKCLSDLCPDEYMFFASSAAMQRVCAFHTQVIIPFYAGRAHAERLSCISPGEHAFLR